MELRDYQESISSRAAELLHQHRIAYLSMECRTGKTLTALASAIKYGAERVLFVTKKKAIPSVVGDYEALGKPYAFEITNYESVHKVSGDCDLVILDEAHSLGAFPRPGKHTKDIKQICRNLPILYLSGTPSPESFSQLYHQFWVSSFSPWKRYANFYKWAKDYVYPIQKMINGYNVTIYSATDDRKIRETTRHLFIDYSQEEAGFEANINETVLPVLMDSRSRNAFKEMCRDRIINIGGNSVLGDTPAKLMSKLHQISSGTVIDEDGSVHILDCSKAEFIRTQFKGKKIAIFYVYQGELEILKRVFPNYTDSPEEFQSSADKVFISQVRRAREGVRLDTADALIFFNLEYSFLSYEQGKNRLSSKERTAPAEVYFPVSDFGIETDILNAVRNKADFTLSYYCSKHKDLIK